YMRDEPTREFMRWDGTPFKDAPRRRRKKQNPVAESRNTPLRKSATPPLRKTATLTGTSVAESRNMGGPEALRDSATYLVNHSVPPSAAPPRLSTPHPARAKRSACSSSCALSANTAAHALIEGRMVDTAARGRTHMRKTNHGEH